MELLSRHEEFVLLAVWKLQEQAYGAEIRNYLTNLTDEDWSIASVYTPLDRLEKKGLVRSYRGDPTPERGGRHKRLFRITAEGAYALERVDQIQRALRMGLPKLVAG